jgi:hypothetical protein
MQQFRFIDPFKSALRVSGVNYAHQQERLTVFTAFGMIQSNAPEDGRN